MREYTNEEVTEIIRVALQKAGDGERNAVSHDELLAIAGDLGLTAADIDVATRAIATSQDQSVVAARAAQHLKIHGVSYVAGILGLFLINAVVSRDFWWFLIPAAAYLPVFLVHTYLTKSNPQMAIEMMCDDSDEVPDSAHSTQASK